MWVSVSGYLSFPFQEMYPDRLLVSPAPAGGNTNWFDPFFQVMLKKCMTTIPILMIIRHVKNLAVESTTWQHTIMRGKLIEWWTGWKCSITGEDKICENEIFRKKGFDGGRVTGTARRFGWRSLQSVAQGWNFYSPPSHFNFKCKCLNFEFKFRFCMV